MKRVLLLLCLFSLTALRAETFWLLSRMAPLPFNPRPEAETLLLRSNDSGGIWLVDDTPWNKVDNPVNTTRTLSNLVFTWTNVTQTPISNLPLPEVRFIGATKPSYNTNLLYPHMGWDLLQMSKDEPPGWLTNWTAEQLSDTRPHPPSTNTYRTLRPPAHIHKGSPTFKEDLEQWRRENFPEKFKRSGGGDIIFDGVDWYNLELVVLKSALPFNVPYGWSQFTPSLTTLRQFVDTNLVTTLITNHNGSVALHSDKTYLYVKLEYPDAAVQTNEWRAGWVNFYGEFCDGNFFDRTNTLYVVAEYVGHQWKVTFEAGDVNCIPAHEYSYLSVSSIESIAPFQVIPWPLPPVQLNPLNPEDLRPWNWEIKTFGPGFKGAEVQLSTNLIAWATLTNGMTDVHGYVEFNLPASALPTNDAVFFNVLIEE